MNLSALPINVHSPAAVSGRLKWMTRQIKNRKKLQAPENVYPVSKEYEPIHTKKGQHARNCIK